MGDATTAAIYSDTKKKIQDTLIGKKKKNQKL
jgi:hypothetical protein